MRRAFDIESINVDELISTALNVNAGAKMYRLAGAKIHQ
jgi:hypothetical protein